MAGIRTFNMRKTQLAAAVAVAVVMLAVVVMARPGRQRVASSSLCPTEDTYVYPYWSYCDAPAELSTGYHYKAVSLFAGGLEPEYDETNSTYYVRFAGSALSSGASYVAVGATSDSGVLLVNSTVYIYNSKTLRSLVWRQEGTDEFFLIEQTVDTYTDGAPFRLVEATSGVYLPCPLIYPPVMCKAYYLVSDPSSSTYTDAGLTSYTEGGVTYVKAAAAGSAGDLPLLVQTSYSTSTSAVPVSTIRSVTQ